jgi:hypothetical protein
MNLSQSSSFSKDRDLLSRLFFYDQDRHIWIYNHDDQVFKVMAACAKLNVPCRNVPKDDPSTVEITHEDWERVFTSSAATDSPYKPPSQEAVMTIHPSESIDPETPFEKEKHNTATKVRYYRFDGANDTAVDPKADEILLAAESEMADEDEQDMEKAVHALAERTQATFVSQEHTKDEDDDRPSPPSSLAVSAEASKDHFPTPSESPQKPKDASMSQDENQTVKHAIKDKPLENKNFGDLSSWEQVLEDRESTLAAREKVLRLRQKDVQDMEERLHEERKAFNADYEEKKAFLEDKEQRLKKIFERMEEVAYEFRRNTRSEGEVD